MPARFEYNMYCCIRYRYLIFIPTRSIKTAVFIIICRAATLPLCPLWCTTSVWGFEIRIYFRDAVVAEYNRRERYPNHANRGLANLIITLIARQKPQPRLTRHTVAAKQFVEDGKRRKKIKIESIARAILPYCRACCMRGAKRREGEKNTKIIVYAALTYSVVGSRHRQLYYNFNLWLIITTMRSSPRVWPTSKSDFSPAVGCAGTEQYYSCTYLSLLVNITQRSDKNRNRSPPDDNANNIKKQKTFGCHTPIWSYNM